MPEGIRGQPLKLSKFHCREMLYDYLMGRLDKERTEALERGLDEFPDLKAELESLKAAIHFCTDLSKISVHPHFIEDLQSIRLRSEVVVDKVKYRNWPDLLRWSSEAIVISVFVAAVGWIIPWDSIPRIFEGETTRDIILADVNQKPIDEKKVDLPPLSEKEPVKVEAPIVSPEPTVPPEPIAPVAPVVSSAPPAVAVATPKPAVKKAPKGFLYRIMMNVSGIHERAPELRDQIIAMGGKKAGQVEIGHRQPNGSYFHFSMPEANYQSLLSTLGAYGPARVYKGPHARVMPDGIIRIILTIEDAPAQTADSALESESTEELSPPDDTTSDGE